MLLLLILTAVPGYSLLSKTIGWDAAHPLVKRI